MYGSDEDNKENIFPFPIPKIQPNTSNVLCDPTQEIVIPLTKEEKDKAPSPLLSQGSNASSVFDSPCMPSTAGHGEEDTGSEDGESTSRKDKSLGLLCQRFLIAMNEETRCSMAREVHLETVARKMNVEKRRIYDIVNVMEALDGMQKTNKSFYRWSGLDHLPQLMLLLQQEAIEEGLPERVHRVEQAMCSFTELSPGARQKLAVGSLMMESPKQTHRRQDIVRDRQGRNSLAQLCRRFLMVLLSNPKDTRRVSLDVASTVLIKDPEREGFEPPSRSRCRRLYDIANVLVALGLIKKVHYLFGTKKIPLFVYSGPEPDEKAKFDVNACLERLLSTTQSAPQTPQMKATTAAMMQSLSMAKRSFSDADLVKSHPPKMARIKSEDMVSVASASSSLMMFAELAAERLRQENLASAIGIPKPQPTRYNFGLPPMSAIDSKTLSQIASFSGLSPSPMWTSMRSPVIMSREQKPLPVYESKPVIQSMPRHSVSNILGASNKPNIPSNIPHSLHHKDYSAFKPIPKISKTPFGAVQNLPGRF